MTSERSRLVLFGRRGVAVAERAAGLVALSEAYCPACAAPLYTVPPALTLVEEEPGDSARCAACASTYPVVDAAAGAADLPHVSDAAGGHFRGAGAFDEALRAARARRRVRRPGATNAAARGPRPRRALEATGFLGEVVLIAVVLAVAGAGASALSARALVSVGCAAACALVAATLFVRSKTGRAALLFALVFAAWLLLGFVLPSAGVEVLRGDEPAVYTVPRGALAPRVGDDAMY